VLTYSKIAIANERQRQRRTGDLTPGSRVQSHGGSDTPAPPARTRLAVQRRSARTEACLRAVSEDRQESQIRSLVWRTPMPVPTALLFTVHGDCLQVPANEL